MKLSISERDNNTCAAIEVMRFNEQFQDEPRVAIFWYDTNKDELFGVRMTHASDAKWYESSQFNAIVKTEKDLHKNVWNKEKHRGKDKRFKGDHTLVPRGRVFEFKDDGFRVYTGSWINNYPEAKELILDEFELPKDNTTFIQDSHWDIGHGWSQEF